MRIRTGNPRNSGIIITAFWIIFLFSSVTHGAKLSGNSGQHSTAPSGNSSRDSFVLLAWSDVGMHFLLNDFKFFSLHPPWNNLHALLIRRGRIPKITSREIEIRYQVEPGFESPAQHSLFWKYAPVLFAKRVRKNIGLKGRGLSGTMDWDNGKACFFAQGIPVLPYGAGGVYNPFPEFNISALEKRTGKKLAETRVIAPVSTQMGCGNCHGKGNRAVDSEARNALVARDILQSHDRLSQTALLGQAESGRPVNCLACHGNEFLKFDGGRATLNLSAAIHGFHAERVHETGGKACLACHPASAKQRSPCFRGVHARKKMDCTSCHGTMKKHALSLLLMERRYGKKVADPLIASLKQSIGENSSQIKSRDAWANEPDCLNCHPDFQHAKKRNTFNQWTKYTTLLYRNRSDANGIPCAACHGATHAVHSKVLPNDTDPKRFASQDNSGIQATDSCIVCHTVAMRRTSHHANILPSIEK